MEVNLEEIKRQREQFQFEIEVLRERILELEREKEGSIYGWMCKSVSVQKTPKNMNTTSDNRPINAQVDKQVDKRIKEPDKRRTPREKVVLSQTQARARRSEKELTNPLRKIYAQMATSGPAKITTEKAWTEVTGNSRR